MQRKVVEGYRLSPQQKRLWSLQQDASTFRAQCMVEINGPLDKAALLECLNDLVGRHDALRTVFHRLAGMKTPVQVVRTGTDVDWQAHDLTQAGDQPERVRELYERHTSKKFDLEDGPALHASLIALSKLEHRLILSLPALCGDSKTITGLVKKLAQAYAERRGGRTASRDEVQYVQYSDWQNRLGGDSLVKDLSSQSQSLLTAANLKLPLEMKPDGQAAFTPACIEVALDHVDSDNLADSNASVEEFLLACWMTLIWRLSPAAEIVIGNLWDGRGHAMLQDAVGLFARWLPVGCGFEKDYDFSEILERVKKSLKEAHDFRERFIWEEADPPGDSAGFPSIGFEFEQEAEAVVAGEVTMKAVRQYAITDRFKVKLSCFAGQRIRAELRFDEARVSRMEAELIASRYSAIVRQAAGAQSVTVDKVEVLGEQERRLIVEEWNDTAREYPRDKSIVAMFEEQAKRRERAIAVECEGKQITYDELNKRANQLARYLKSRGVRAESAVGIMLDRSVDLVVGLLAIMKAEGAYVPLDPHLPSKRITLMLEDCGSPLVITRKTFRAESARTRQENVYIDGDWEAIAQESDENLERTYSPENLAYILFTSGSTGKPKGVAIEHSQLVNYINAIRERLELPAEASYATVSTFSADLGNTVIFPSLCAGATLHIISQDMAADASALADYFKEHSIDCLKIVPSHLTALLASPTPERLIPRKRLILGGEASHWSLIDKIESLKQDCLVFNHYGPTETTVGVSTYAIKQAQRPRSAATVPIGEPIGNIQAYILDTYLNPVPIGVAGELYFSGEGVTRGYLNGPDLTADRFIPNPLSPRNGARMYRTGDLGRYLPDGNIEFLGRADHQVKYHGFRVELAEIAVALNHHPKIINSVVRIAPDKNGEDVLIAYYVSRQEIEMSELRAFLSDSIMIETLPNVFVHLRKLPLTLNGKVNFDMLPSLEEVRQRRPKEFVAPRNQVEEKLAQIYADVLGLQDISITDNFFELGGHSLLATRVISRICESLKLDIPVRSLFETPSIAALSEMISARREQSREPVMQAIPRRARSIDEQLAELNDISEDQAQALLDA